MAKLKKAIIFLLIIIIGLVQPAVISVVANDGSTNKGEGNYLAEASLEDDDSKEDEQEPAPPVAKDGQLPPGSQLVASAGDLELYVVIEGVDFGGDRKNTGEFCIKSKSSGQIWYSNPQDRFEDEEYGGAPRFEVMSQLLVHTRNERLKTDKVLSSFRASNYNENVEVTKIENGFRTEYRFETEGITVPLYVTLDNDGLKVSTRFSEIKEGLNKTEEQSAEEQDSNEEEDINRVVKVSLAPYFGSGSTKDKGYILVPDGSGSIINFNNGKSNLSPYKANVYGDDPSLAPELKKNETLPIMLPMFGINRNEAAFIAVATSGEQNATLEAYVSGMRNQNNNAYFTFNTRAVDVVIVGQSNIVDVREVIKYDMEHPQLEEIAVKYYLMDKGKFDYSEMAIKLRSILKKMGVGENVTVKNIPPFYLEVYGGMTKKETFLGFLVERFKKLTTFEQAGEIIDDLNVAGVNDIVLAYRYWNKPSIYDKMPSKVQPFSRLGGWKDFNMLSEKLKDNFYPDYNPFDNKKSGYGFNKFFDTAKRISKEPVLVFEYFPSHYYKNLKKLPIYLVKPSKLEKYTDSFVKGLTKNKLNSLYLPTLGNTLYSDFNTRNYIFRKGSVKPSFRQDTLEYMKKGLESFNGNTLVTQPNMYALPFTSQALAIPTNSSGYDIFDYDVPFYQIAISGLVNFSVPAVNMSHSPQELKLKALETGGGLYFTWIYNDTSILKESKFNYLVGSDYKKWFDYAVEAQKEIKNVNSQLGSNVIVGHTRIADKVFLTEFDSGNSILVNYSDKTVKTDYGELESKSYKVIVGGGDNNV